jgi:hypothetical protein
MLGFPKPAKELAHKKQQVKQIVKQETRGRIIIGKGTIVVGVIEKMPECYSRVKLFWEFALLALFC